MATRDQKVHGIIHATSATAAGVGAGLAQIPGSDAAVLVPLQATMIIAIAHAHGTSLDRASATSLVLTFAATMAGRTVSQLLIGWLPAVGNIINASTAAGLTEAIGWAAHTYFCENEGG